VKERRESVRGGKVFQLTSTQTDEGPYRAVLARARFFEGRSPREGIPGRESFVLFTEGGVEAVFGGPRRLDGKRAKANYQRGERGRQQECQRFGHSVRGGQTTPAVPTPSGSPKRSQAS